MQVGTTKDQGLYNKPSAAVHPGALAAGILPQYNTIQYNTLYTWLEHKTVHELVTEEKEGKVYPVDVMNTKRGTEQR